MVIDNRINKYTWSISLSATTCLISVIVFLSMLFSSTRQYQIAQAKAYTGEQILLAVNKQRLKNQFKPLLLSDKLNLAADNKAKDMVKNNYFSHISPKDGKKWSQFIKEAGYEYLEAGENLAHGYETAEELVDAWMKSPSHKANILNESYEDTGIGIAYQVEKGQASTIFVVQNFGRSIK